MARAKKRHEVLRLLRNHMRTWNDHEVQRLEYELWKEHTVRRFRDGTRIQTIVDSLKARTQHDVEWAIRERLERG